jgi:hypothetical protein
MQELMDAVYEQRDLLQRRLDHNAQHVLLAVAHYTDPRTGQAYASHRAFALYTGLRESTVEFSLRALKQAGFIEFDLEFPGKICWISYAPHPDGGNRLILQPNVTLLGHR